MSGIDMINKKIRKGSVPSIKGYLEKHQGQLAINFSGLTSIDGEALLRFFKKLRAYNTRIKLVSIDYLKSEWSELVHYAKSYYEVLSTEEVLAGG
jgi:anti-anti-sigma regulatory factor